MKVAVTGGSGLVGKYVAQHLYNCGHEVVVVDLVSPPWKFPHAMCDVMDLPRLREVFRGSDAVAHLAGIPHPLDQPPEVVFQTNAIGTFNVLQAASELGVKRVVLASSESTLGFAFMKRRMVPDYVPIDENHPMRPQDPYGLSKVVAEEICRAFAQRTGMTTIALRMPWIWVPEEAERARYRELILQYEKWYKNLWAYIHVYDVAEAFRLALETMAVHEFEPFFVTADDNWTLLPSRKLLALFFPEVENVAATWAQQLSSGGERASFISSQKAKTMHGFSPKYSWRDLDLGIINH